jgi:hypothetical protein
MRIRWQLFAIALAACGAKRQSPPPTAAPPGESPAAPPGDLIIASLPPATSKASTTAPLIDRREVADLQCPASALRLEGGVERGIVCANAVTSPMVALDLGDAWTPRMFAGSAELSPDFRAGYLALAQERDVDGQPLPPNEALLELYGIVPAFSVVRARLADTARHACHAKIDSTAIAKLDKPFGQDHGALVAANDQRRVWLASVIDKAKKAAKPVDPKLEEIWRVLDEQHRGIVAAQRHLACEGFLREQDADGTMTWRTGIALEMFQRRNFLLPNNRLDDETRAALATDSRELDFRFALRVLRERVVDATGLIEDGTAGAGPAPVLGRMLDPKAMRAARGAEAPLPDGAPDLIAAATEAAAKQLGWADHTTTLAFLQRHARGVRVVVELPPPPAYHREHMELAAVIDRGDVYYDSQPIPRTPLHRPNLVVYAIDGTTKRALMRWPTTIGGWADVLLPGGGVVQKWKESDVGPRIWRDVYAAPTWLPPRSTPDRDLVKNLYNGKFELKRSIIGPGPRAAFGMVLLPHYATYKVKTAKGEEERIIDNGIGTHGSASVTSIVNGTSHGCHRLYNQLAVRLGNFLIRHREHVVKGQQPEYWRRLVQYRGSFLAKVDTRGFLYELTPPVSIDVTRGTIKTPRKTPPLSAAPARP